MNDRGKRSSIDLPSREALEAERNRLSTKNRFRKALTSTICVLIVVAAVAVLVSMIVMPVFRITGQSMEPMLTDGEIVLCLKDKKYETGQICGFYYGNKLLLKRVIAKAGDWVNIDENGNVYVNNGLLNEPYVTTKSIGNNDLTYPYQVPDGTVFVMGDNREKSIDSRSELIGCIKTEDVVGRVLMRIWPLKNISLINQY